MNATQEPLGFSLENLIPFRKKTPRKKAVDSPTSTATLPTPATNGHSQEVIEMAKKPSDVLSFFVSPSGKYMAHFFHFIGDTPVVKEETTTNRKKETKTKIVAETKKPKLYLSDVDAIVKRHTDLGGKQTYETIAIGMLEPSLMDELEAAKVDVDAVITWAKAEGKSKVDAAPKKEKKTTPPVAAEVKVLTGILCDVAASKTPEQMATMLVKMVNNEEWMNKAVARLEDAVKTNGRDTKGYIKLRNRK